ncbi:glycosyltransferase [Candidatus Kaiserbacteria bacterium]|nr:glycosyltransferase [Candidatus Kaiserbacteria bacterium]
MKLLICTQAVDAGDSDLGFFVHWLQCFAKNCNKITVICLREGKHDFPKNVKVIALGAAPTQEVGAPTMSVGVGRMQKAAKLISLAWKLRNEYDSVFVHMNPEYVVVAGMLWRFMNKRVALWYTHKSVNLKLRIAVLFSHIVFTASAESLRLQTKKLRVMGHGIDTDFFSPDTSIAREDWILSVGRLMKSKRHDLAIRTAIRENKELRIAGEGTERKNLELLARELGARVQFLGALTQSQLREEYRKARCLIHTSETGSLDKVVLEALACGLPVQTNDPALKTLENVSPEYVREHHSLQRLIPAILGFIKTI